MRWFVFVVVGSVVLSGTYFLLRPSNKPDKDKKYKFMYCDKCGKEMAYNPSLLDSKCPRCKPGTTPGNLIPTEESLGGGKPNPWRKAHSALVVESMILLWVFVWMMSRKKQETGEVKHHVFACPSCKRPLRYQATSVGKPGKCPRCHKQFVFPEGTPEDEYDRYDEGEDTAA